jgi:hypothetical protein
VSLPETISEIFDNLSATAVFLPVFLTGSFCGGFAGEARFFGHRSPWVSSRIGFPCPYFSHVHGGTLSVDTDVKKIEQLKLEQWLTVSIPQEGARRLNLSVDEKVLEELRRLDGCYVLKTDVPETLSAKEEIHERYNLDSRIFIACFKKSSQQLYCKNLTRYKL